MMRNRFTGPERLITIGAGVFIFALAVSAVFVPAIRWLHVAQASMDVAVVFLSIKRSPWGHFVGASAASLWDALAMQKKHELAI